MFALLISLPMMVCLFWGIYFLIHTTRPDNEPRVTRLLVAFFAAATILYLDHWLYFSGIFVTAGEWSYGVVNLCVYPLYYAYLRALTRARSNWEITILLLPALVSAVLFPINRWGGILSDNTLFLFTRACFSLQVVWVLVRGYMLLLQTIHRMDNTYSDDRSRLLQPTYISLILFGVTSAVSMVLNVFGRDYFAHEMLVLVPALVMAVLLYGLGFVAAHTVIPMDTVADENDSEEATPEETKDLIHAIDAVMREKMLFTNPNLTIQDLAMAVNSNRTYVSNAINRTYHISFSQYVARQRVAYAQLILRDSRYPSDKAAVNDAITLSGFNSEQTFYRAFKEITRTTPLNYRKNY